MCDAGGGERVCGPCIGEPGWKIVIEYEYGSAALHLRVSQRRRACVRHDVNSLDSHPKRTTPACMPVGPEGQVRDM